jgi:hypothetical protein
MKIRRIGAEFFHSDRRTDIFAFRNFANAPKYGNALYYPNSVKIKIIPEKCGRCFEPRYLIRKKEKAKRVMQL